MTARAPLPLALVGCDFREASTSWRGRLVLDKARRAELHRSLADAAGARGLAVLDTCNRTEWIVDAEQAEWAAALLRTWMLRLWREGIGCTEHPEPHVLLATDAARHLIRVAVGLESVVPGEREIATQVNRALRRARTEQTSSPLLNELAQAAARTVRRVERSCRFREPTRGVHALALDRVREWLPDGGEPAIALAGCGQVGRRVADHFARAGLSPSRLFNRTSPDGHDPRYRPLDELHGALHELDVLVVATGAPRPVLTVDGKTLPPGRRLIVDLGVPAQVEAVSAEGLEVAGLDDLLSRGRVAGDREEREVVETVVEDGLEAFLLAWHKSPVGALLRHVQASRDRLGLERLPALLDDCLPGVPDAARKRLETALRGAILERDRELVAEIERAMVLRTRTDPDAPRGTPRARTDEAGR